jgi:hypothetical protein
VPDNVTGLDLVAGSGVAVDKTVVAGTRGNLARYQISVAAGRNFYLAASDASDISGYKTLLTSPSAAAEQQIPVVCTGTGDVAIEEFATDPGIPGAADYPAGTALRSLYARVSAGSARIHLQVYVRNAAGAETLVRDEFSPVFTNTTVALQQWIASPPSGGTLLATDRLVTKLSAQRVSGPTSITVTTHYEGESPAQIQTTIPAPVSTAIPVNRLTPGALGAMLYTAAGPVAVWTDPTRIGIFGNSLQFGDGSTSDTAVGRGSNAQEFSVSNYLRVYRTVTANDEGTNVVLGETGSGPGLKVGSDVRLYRSAASVLKTDSALIAVGLSSLLAAVDTQPTFRANPSGKLEWGVGGATVPDALANLYRSAAGRIKTDGTLEAGVGFILTPGNAVTTGLGYFPTSIVAGSMFFTSTVLGEANHRFRASPVGTIQWGAGGASGVDAALYRGGVGMLQVSTNLTVVGSITVDYGNTGTKLLFGSAPIRRCTAQQPRR